ncbi:MAG: glycosyltransferase family 2 protein [Acidimicrobiales bacterium]|jgi:N-acetylglucosaminyl-diphospho-decaprenol L-rhamnosyltransferase
MNSSEDQPSMCAIAAVIVNYNAGDALSECVASLEREHVREIVVVDNGSTDGSLDCLPARFPEVRVLHTGRNLGYGGGVNFGAHEVGGDLILVCNPDLQIQTGAVNALLSRIERDQSLGLVGPALVGIDRGPHPSGRAFPTVRRSSLQAALGVLAPGSTYSRRYREANRARAATGIVDWVTGACFLVRREAFDAVGGFDDRYFMYVEEVDLCWRLTQAGWRIGYESSAHVLHLAGVSTAAAPFRMIAAHHWSLWRFARRTTSGSDRLLLPFVAVGIALRFSVVCLRRLVAAVAKPSRRR